MVPVSFGVRRGGAGRLALVQRRSVVLLLIASLLAGLGAVAPAGSRTALGNGAGPRTWYVGPGDGLGGGFPSCTFPDFTTGGGFDSSSGSIQRAVDAAATGDTIHLCDHTYELTAGIDVAGATAAALTFEGETTAGTIVDGLDAVRLFYAEGKDVAFVRLTLQNGTTDNLRSDGGAVYARDVAVHGAVFRDNTAGNYGGAIGAAGNVTITDGTFIDNAAGYGSGAIDANQNLRVRGGVFRGNSGGYEGGAVWVYQLAELADVLFEDNSAGTQGGAIACNALSATDATFVGNRATDGGAIRANSATLTRVVARANHATLTNGAAAVYGPTTVTDSIFEDNSAGDTGALGSDDAVTVTGSLFTRNTASTGVAGAIYAISLTMSDTDLTSNTAVLNGGAVYAGSGLMVDVRFRDNSATTGGAAYFSGTASITDGIFTGNHAREDGGAVVAMGELEVSGGSSFTGNAAENGGAIRAGEGGTTLRGATFSDNTADTSGGAVATNGPLWVYGGTFERNVAAADGGALWNNNQVYVERATFTENRADYQGGAIRSTSSLTVSDGTFVDNSAGTPGCNLDECGGGAIHAWGSVDVGGSTFHANFSWTRGGAIQAGSTVPADLLVRRTTFVENTAGSGGGAVYNIGSSTGVYSSTFVDNVGSAAAGGTDGSAVFNSNAIVGASLFVGGGCTGSIFTTGVVVADAPGCGGSAGVVAARADLLLGSLASNGGPTETVALGKGSLAIDPSNAADGCDDTTDQRGFPRPALSACDAGAYEFQGPVDRTTGITVRAYVDGVELTAGQAIPTGTDVTFRAEVSLTDGTDADLTSGQVYLLLCRATPLPANCSFDSASFFFIGPLSVTEGTSPGDLIAVASHSESLTERGEYRVGAYYMTPGGRIGGSEVTTGTPSFRLTSSIVIVWDATAGVVADTGTVPLRAETRAYQGGPLVGACPITFTVTDMAGNPVTTASATSGELTGVASATASGLTTPGVYLVSMTTGEVCAAAKPGWGVVTVGSTAKYPRGTVGAIGGGRYFLSGNSGQSVSFGLRLDATTSTAGKGKTAITTTRTNLRFIWVASDGWRLTSSTTGDATTGATPFTKPACSTVTASDEANNTATYPRGTICGQVVFDGTLEEWSTGTGAWVNPTPTRFTIRMADGGSARAGDNGDWFGWTNSTVEALLVAQARPLRVGATAPFTYRGRLFVY